MHAFRSAMIRRVAVGISGGVDSAVAALLLQRRGLDVRPVFMKNWDLVDEQGQCPGEADLHDAQFVCDRLGLRLTEVNFVKEYWNEVFGNFLQDYEDGITPNPDILCNRFIKFDAFFKHCTRTLCVDAIATGHYARNSWGDYLENAPPDDAANEYARLLCAVDAHKDQTFFLSQIPQRALRRTMFPLGSLPKSQVKELARQAGLERIARKRESTGICFVGRRNFNEFIGAYIADRSGEFRNHDTGAAVGTHAGFHRWTVGQRSRVEGNERQLFVQRKCDRTNAIYLAPGTDHPAMFSDSLYTDGPVWLADDPMARRPDAVFECQFRFQHTKPLTRCWIVRAPAGRLMVRLESALRSITPGQYAVFYRAGECLGSARITAPGPSMEQLENV